MRGPRERHLPFDRVLQLFIVGFTTACAVFIQTEVRDLRSQLESRKNNLYEFLASQGSLASANHDPETAEVRLRNLVGGRSWVATFGGLRPTVLMTDTGPVLRLVRQGKHSKHSRHGGGGR